MTRLMPTGTGKLLSNLWTATPTQTTFTMRYNFGDIVLIEFPYTNGIGIKKRPALVIYDSGDPDIVVARITSQSVATGNDIPLSDWKSTGLNVASTVRLHKVAMLEKLLISRTIGHVSASDEQTITIYLKQVVAGL